jgi:hypothetical protein
MPATAEMHQHVTGEMRHCAEVCHRCHTVCLETISHCLHLGGDHADPHHIRLMMDCVQICRTSEDFLLRGSDLHAHTCRACAVICDRCAQDCDRLARAGGDGADMMRSCAEECRRCAQSCQRMSAAA